MKKIYLPFFLAAASLLTSVAGFTQVSTNWNFVSKTDVLAPGVVRQGQVDSLQPGARLKTVGYFDGLGRPQQTVGLQMSPSGKDIVTPVEYDGCGREIKKYLPYADSGVSGYGSLRTTAYANQLYFYSVSDSAV